MIKKSKDSWQHSFDPDQTQVKLLFAYYSVPNSSHLFSQRIAMQLKIEINEILFPICAAQN